MKTQNTISGKCYYAVLHAKKPLTTLEVVSETKVKRGMTSQYCLNCDGPIITRADKPNLFCTGKCSKEYYLKKQGLI